ncbi:Hypothetical predicted protein [Paramuricea clavata]|uniref:HD domain-containing protein n=1 Tax=Paramuricea clavata TaxID=317549 RepID=A0A6S7GGQ5_PARCT|nr:Hypothetical predicted protein [Paramuricea clavata]
MEEADEQSSIIFNVFSLYKKYGDNDYLGEPVNQLEHAIQCAMLAEKEGYSDEVILGAFLHDIGHLVGKDKNLEDMVTDGVIIGTQNHDKVGENFLKDLGFPKGITDFVRGHVSAKRYLVAKRPGYYDQLSSASKMTLVHQGGPMNNDEAATFEKLENFEAILRMRSWDEQAKVENMIINPLGKYEAMCKTYLNTCSM